MKKMLLRLIILLVIVAPFSFLSAQNNTIDSLATVLAKYDTVKSDQLTSYHTLNVFFGNKIAGYLSETGDLSLTKGYALLDNTDNRLFLGGTFALCRATKKEKLNTVLTLGIKANVKDGFAGLFGSGNFKDDIGFSAKLTLFGNGSIWFDKADPTQKLMAINNRALLKKEILTAAWEEVKTFKQNTSTFNFQDSLVKKYVEKKKKEIDDKFGEKEAEAIAENKWYNLAHTWWLSFEGYIPVSNSKNFVAPSFSSIQFDTIAFKPYEATVTYTNFWEKNKIVKIPFPKGKYYLITSLSLLNYNNIKTENLEGYSYVKYLEQSSISDTSFAAHLKDDKVYVGKYNKFMTSRFRIRFVYMPLPYIGISAGLEKFVSKKEYDYSPVNWKLGIPVSLKDKEGKAKVNFEFQWREINGDHSLGLSIAFPFGNTVF